MKGKTEIKLNSKTKSQSIENPPTGTVFVVNLIVAIYSGGFVEV